ncbi:MAG: carbohydrate kinase [Paracoccaceae bacterium]|nr:carbohydrate kinase [Paracoccaceae bacterium]
MILCAGECLIDMLPRETTEGGAAYQPFVGGSVFNTANALGRLGQPVGFFSGISTDFFGEMLMDTLNASGVDASFAARPDRPTTLAFVRLVDGHASYLFYDENSAGRMLSTADIPTVSDQIDTLFFGCISLAVEPCAATYEALMMRDGGARVTMLDPNIRAGFIQDEAAYRARLDRMLAAADLVKVSDEDLIWMMGDGDLAEKAEAMRAKGPAIVFVTEGAKGVTAYSQHGPRFVTAPKVEVVDTVGAGDTFNGGLLTSLREQGALTKSAIRALSPDQIDAATTLGARAAAITVSRAGANPPTRAEL